MLVTEQYRRIQSHLLALLDGVDVRALAHIAAVCAHDFLRHYEDIGGEHISFLLTMATEYEVTSRESRPIVELEVAWVEQYHLSLKQSQAVGVPSEIVEMCDVMLHTSGLCDTYEKMPSSQLYLSIKEELVSVVMAGNRLIGGLMLRCILDELGPDFTWAERITLAPPNP